MSKISKKHKEFPYKTLGSHQKFLSRITKTLYYGKLPKTECLSLPVTELAAELFSEAKRGNSLDILRQHEAAAISRNACVSPCSLVLALLYLERLKTCNPEYLKRSAPSELFLVSLMISSKFLYDDGEGDEVFMDEWATSGGVTIKEMLVLERDFLTAIDWEIFVNEKTFWNRLKTLETTLAKREGFKRGWYTYTELENLLNLVDIQNILQIIAYFSAIVLATYAAGILTIIGSVLIVNNMPLPNSHLRIRDNNLPVFNKENLLDVSDANKTEIFDLPDIEINKTPKPIDAVDVLKTGIFLASIKVLEESCNRTEFQNESNLENAEFITWDWWESPVMNWLSETSRILHDFGYSAIKVNFHDVYMDMSVANVKKLQLQDHIDKATKMRIQEQMERSWHMEWTDTIRKCVGDMNLLSYFQFQDAIHA